MKKNEDPAQSAIADILRLREIQPRKSLRVLQLSQWFTPYMLCHNAAMLTIETGFDIRFFQRLLRHSSIATIEIYACERLPTTSNIQANALAGISWSD